MANEKTAKADTKKTGSTKKVESNSQSTTMQVKGLIEGSGNKGITALALAQQLNLVNDRMEKPDRAAALKKVRVLARKVTGGKAMTRAGRSAIYRIDIA
jgi:hypothetical protein